MKRPKPAKHYFFSEFTRRAIPSTKSVKLNTRAKEEQSVRRLFMTMSKVAWLWCGPATETLLTVSIQTSQHTGSFSAQIFKNNSS